MPIATTLLLTLFTERRGRCIGGISPEMFQNSPFGGCPPARRPLVWAQALCESTAAWRSGNETPSSVWRIGDSYRSNTERLRWRCLSGRRRPTGQGTPLAQVRKGFPARGPIPHHRIRAFPLVPHHRRRLEVRRPLGGTRRP